MEHNNEHKVFFMGIEVSPFTYEQLHETIRKVIENRGSFKIFNVNIHAINLCFKNRTFFNSMREADYVFCDGEGVRQAMHYYGDRVPYRITYADWVEIFFPWLSEKGYSIAFLGANPDILEKAVQKVRQQYPDLRLTGVVDGYLPETEQLTKLQNIRADILLVGMGMPMQELWICRNQRKLPFSIYLSGGAVFDYLSQEISRAPVWMRNWGMEWFYRFILEPRRMFVRYILGNPLFAARVLLSKKPFDNRL